MSSSRVPPPSGVRPHILIVEDDKMVLETIVLMLEDHYDIVQAGSVMSGLAVLSAPETPSIDVTLIDCLLPEGRVADLLAAADRRAIPVVLVSGDPGQAEALGATRPFLQKPFSQAALLAVLDSARR